MSRIHTKTSASHNLTPHCATTPGESSREYATEILEMNHGSSENVQKLPPFDKALGTRNWCLVGLGTSYCFAIVLITYGSIIVFSEQSVSGFNATSNEGKEIMILAFNACVTAITECLGYVHATSLRWALYHEDRLEYNSNLRLWTFSRKCMPNSWFINTFWALLLTASYSCASQTLLSDIFGTSNIWPNFLAMMLLGACLFLLCLLATWSLLPRYRRQIISWNSDPLNTTLALLHNTWCQPPTRDPTIPLSKQMPIREKHPETSLILVYLWFLVPVLMVTGIVLIRLNRQADRSFLDQDPNYSNVLIWNTGDDGPGPVIINIFLLAAFQVPYTLALHSVEQLVNFHRDESAWRRASKLDAQKGAVIGQDSTKVALTSWKTLFLLIMKPTVHWLFGLSIVVDPWNGILFHPMPVFTLCALMLVLAAFATFLIFHQPKGAQPSIFGDLEVLAELVDDWGEGAGGKLFWGDKGDVYEETDRVRCAGTSAAIRNVSAIKMHGIKYRGVAGKVKRTEAY